MSSIELEIKDNSSKVENSKPDRSVSIVIPSYNESERIIAYLDLIKDYISSSMKTRIEEVIIVNDGSKDNTEEVVSNWIESLELQEKEKFSVVGYGQNQGKGFAVREGFLQSSSDFIMYTDADGASPIEEIEKLLLGVSSGYDVCCGSRVLKDESVKVKMSFNRRFTGFVFHIILQILGLAELQDTQCGFKLFKKEVAKKLAKEQKCFNFSFDIEYLFLSKKYGYKIKEIPINWNHVKGSKVNVIVDSLKMLYEVLKIRFIYKYN